MTVHTNLTGYLERSYLLNAYLTEGQHGNDGMQVEFIIADQLKPSGMQVLLGVDSPLDDSFNGMQTQFVIDDEAYVGMQIKADSLSHKQHGNYLVNPYLVGQYLVEEMCTYMGMQAQLGIFTVIENGMQVEMQIVGPDDDSFNGMQVNMRILTEDHLGMQVEVVNIAPIAMQVLATLYNTTNLRILCEFLSRGNANAGGNNAWGNASAQGRNWKANVATDGGPDHEIENLNTDIVEQTWKAATAKSGINLDCDTERTQGVFLDTLGIMNHNLTGASLVQLFGSNTSDFSVIGFNQTLNVITEEPNIIYLAENLPSVAYRYWRISIDDATNPNPVEVGTIIFGASAIFRGECITDEIELQRKDFADSINTEGFTNVKNSRAQKKVVRLNFQSLSFTRGNYEILRNIFTDARTVLKCLWIPTPDIADPEFTSRFAVFSKITEIPLERHNSKGPKNDYASFQLELDESN